jgi:hypothetical protein
MGHMDFHVGPHIMIVSPHQEELQSFNHDGSNGMPYVAHLPNGTQLYLVMPIRQNRPAYKVAEEAGHPNPVK